MAFDAISAQEILAPAQLIDAAADPAADLAETHPDRLLAFLFVAPRECEAVDRLLQG